MRLHGLWLIRTFLPIRTFLDTVAQVSDRQHVSRLQSADFYPIAIYANTIRAAEVADDDRTLLSGHAAMVTRQPERIETCVTRWVPAHHNRRLVYQNVWALVEGHKSRVH
jgi:hypothetical protein